MSLHEKKIMILDRKVAELEHILAKLTNILAHPHDHAYAEIEAIIDGYNVRAGIQKMQSNAYRIATGGGEIGKSGECSLK